MYIGSDSETRAVYDARVKELNDIYSGQTMRYKEGLAEGIEKGRAEGIEKGRAEGIEKGIEQGRAEERTKAEAEKIEMVKGMLSDGLSVEVVSKYSGLPASEIEAIKNS